uniref:PlsC domain-containing protein n=1 Tax=Rhabditophanes sp. KR3021 TaxID=114890 RepID=A0AC35TXF0_9BILA
MLLLVETLLLLSTLFFPPVFFAVIVVILLASFGKSMGLRERYVSTLMRIFAWGATLNTRAEAPRKIRMFIGDCDDLLSTDEENLSSDNELPTNGVEESGNSRRRSTSTLPPTDYSPKADSGIGMSESVLSRVNSSSSITLKKRTSSNASIIQREATMNFEHDYLDINQETYVSSRGWAAITDSLDFMKAGIEAIIEDEVTSRFEAEHLVCWNMLTRTSLSFNQFINWKLSVLSFGGFLFRYLILLPFRMVLFFIGLTSLVFSTFLVALIPNSSFKRTAYSKSMLFSHRILSRSVSAIIHIHNPENKTKGGGVCVANHTSPMDVMILGTDNCYAMIGQQHGGTIGLFQNAFSRGSSHIWFERSEAKDRCLVRKRLKEHVEDPTKLPILIFPEGTCINNTSVMMFKKGSFEIGATIYPIAMKYDSLLGDAFWNSSQQSCSNYILRLLTSWAIICDVWYLPPMTRAPDESAIDFAGRVKKAIALQGGLIDLEWDGSLKRSKVPEKMITKQRAKYSRKLSRYCSTCEGDVAAGLEGREVEDGGKESNLILSD